MTDVEMPEEMTGRVAETVRRALAFVGPADSTVPEVVAVDEDQPVS
jgi:hypothetical protein